jgi:hypothetical protein
MRRQRLHDSPCSMDVSLSIASFAWKMKKPTCAHVCMCVCVLAHACAWVCVRACAVRALVRAPEHADQHHAKDRVDHEVPEGEKAPRHHRPRLRPATVSEPTFIVSACAASCRARAQQGTGHGEYSMLSPDAHGMLASDAQQR